MQTHLRFRPAAFALAAAVILTVAPATALAQDRSAMSRVYAATPQASPQATPQSCECPFPQGYCPFPQGYCPPPQFCGNYAKPYGTPTSYGTPTPYGTPQGPSASPQWAPTPGPAYYPSPQARSAAKASAVR